MVAQKQYVLAMVVQYFMLDANKWFQREALD